MPNPRIAKYLLINPNTNGLTTQRLQEALLPQMPSHASLEVITASFGATYIACEASHAIAGHALLDAWTHQLQTTQTTPDRVLIGCFGDPGLFALRESSACPVTGLAEASFIQAAQSGPFAIVTGG
jgi:Asp/Glu/hydantoin racemase